MKLKKLIYKINLPFPANNDIFEKGLAKVNGLIRNKEYDVLEGDKVTIADISFTYKRNYCLKINKPSGYLSARKDKKIKCVVELLKEPYKYLNWNIAGRLDKDTEGLLILTTSGKFANKIANPIYNVEKEYLATLNKDIKNSDLLKLEEPMILYDSSGTKYISKIKGYKRNSKNSVIVTLQMGKYHQVKKIFKYIGYEVIKLVRRRISNMDLKGIKVGEYLEFQEDNFKF